MNKRNLYESIMRDVSKTVKRSLRESVVSLDDLDNVNVTPAEWEYISNRWRGWCDAARYAHNKNMTPRFWKELNDLLNSYNVTVEDLMEVFNECNI